MNYSLARFGDFLRSFAKEEDGAQIIEYALIVAVVSLGLIALFSGFDFAGWITKVNGCLTNGTTCANLGAAA